VNGPEIGLVLTFLVSGLIGACLRSGWWLAAAFALSILIAASVLSIEEGGGGTGLIFMAAAWLGWFLGRRLIRIARRS
jgi:hypothetical protein